MPVARVITQSPDESEELVRQLTAAGYTVKFAAPDEEFDDADLVVSAANVHADYALQYAAEVAHEANAEVIVAPGVVREKSGQPEVVPEAPEETVAPVGEKLQTFGQGMQLRWQSFRDQRALRREQKRLERERLAMEAEDRRQETLRARAAEEARISAERERLRLERIARDEEMRRSVEAERLRVAAEQQRMAADRERMRAERQAEQDERRRIEEEERARYAEEAERARIAARDRAPAPRPESAPVFYPPVSPSPVQAAATVAPIIRRRPVVAPKPIARHKKMQRAVLAASVVALVLMIAYAIAINTGSHTPFSKRVINNTVQEESPFGPAHSAPAQPVPAVHAAAPSRVVQPATKATTTVPSKPPAAVAHRSTTRRARSGADDNTAEDQVIIHHYGTTPKRPAGSQTRAGIAKYSDEQ